MDRLHGTRSADPLQLFHGALSLPLDEDDALQARDLLREVLHLPENLRFGDEQGLHGCIVDDVTARLDQFRFVHGHVARAEAVGGEGCNDPFETVVGDDSHGVSPADADFAETAAKIADPHVHSPECHPVIRAGGIPGPDIGTVGMPRGGLLPEHDEAVDLLLLNHAAETSLPIRPPVTRPGRPSTP
jgi:hypothetical protein